MGRLEDVELSWQLLLALVMPPPDQQSEKKLTNLPSLAGALIVKIPGCGGSGTFLSRASSWRRHGLVCPLVWQRGIQYDRIFGLHSLFI